MAIAALAGWGAIVERIARVRVADFGLRALLGAACFLAVGGLGGGARMQRVGLAVVLASVGCSAQPAALVAPSCPTRGPVMLASQADIRRVAPCTTLPGVWIRSGAALDTSALRAQTITGDLMIGPTVGTAEVAFGELRTVEGAIRVSSNGLLQGLFLRKLERAGRIDIDGNVALTTVSLPRLTAIRGALRITDNASLEVVDMPMLESIDQELVLTGAPQLTLIDAPELRHAASVEINAPKLSADVTSRLRAVAKAP